MHAGTNDRPILEQWRAHTGERMPGLREQEMLAGLLTWILAQDDAEEPQKAVTRIESWSDRLVTSTGIRLAIWQDPGNNSKSANLGCNN